MKSPNLTALIAILLILPLTALAQNAEKELFAKQQAMLNECNKIAKAVPCAIGVGDEDDLTTAQRKAKRDAIYELAQSIRAFVIFAATDSSFIKNTTSQELSQVIGKIRIDELVLVNSANTRIEYAVITNEINGKRVYRALAQIVIDRQLYAEAQEAIAKAQKEVAFAAQNISNQKQIIKPASSAEVEIPKTDYKRIATKTANSLLDIAKIMEKGL